MTLPQALLAAALACPVAAQESSLIGSVVRSEKWNIKRGEHKIEEFSGDVRYRREGRRLRADWALYDHDQQTLEARGNIRAEERLADGSEAALTAESGTFDRAAGRGWLVGRSPLDGVPLTLRKPDGSEQGRGWSRKLTWNLPRRELALEGDAWFKEERGEVHAEAARFDHGTRSLTLAGRRPVIDARGPGWAAAVQADAFTALALEGSRRRVTGTGRTRGWIHFPSAGSLRP